MTLALLEDSGWWKPDYTRATNLVPNRHWGYKRGCDFYKKKCLSNDGKDIVKGGLDFFCNENTQYSCSPRNQMGMKCNVKNTGRQSTALPELFR